MPVSAPPIGRPAGAPAELPPASRPAAACSASHGTGDTSGFGGLVRRRPGRPTQPAPVRRGTSTRSSTRWRRRTRRFDDAIERVVVDRGELTLHIAPERIAEVCQDAAGRPGAALRAVLSVSGVTTSARRAAGCTSVYHLTSMTYRRRIRLEAAVTVEDPHLPSVTAVYPTADWQEREAYDMFGIIFDGHPGLTRILMPDDWEGHPQRKDYPLGGIPVEYKGAEIPPPDAAEVATMTSGDR